LGLQCKAVRWNSQPFRPRCLHKLEWRNGLYRVYGPNCMHFISDLPYLARRDYKLFVQKMRKPTIQQESVRELEDRLFRAQQALRLLLPPKLLHLLASDGECLTREDVWKWWDTVVQAVAKMGEVIPESVGKTTKERAYCPVCGGSSNSPYTSGFEYPNGLLLHLRGKRGAHECSVLQVFREKALASIENESVKWIRQTSFEPPQKARVAPRVKPRAAKHIVKVSPSVSHCGRYRMGQTWVPTKPESSILPREIVEIGPSQNANKGEIFYRDCGNTNTCRSVTYREWKHWVQEQSATCDWIGRAKVVAQKTPVQIAD
jgi:hypothetical protein